jgi:hypothetical protein
MANTKIKLNLDSLKARRDWKRHKVKDGHNVFRILPPFGEASNGYAYRKWQIIWGLTDPETGRARPFASSMTSEKKCPVTEYVQLLKKKAEKIKGQLQAAGNDEETIKEKMKDFNGFIGDINPKTIYVYNAADKAGEVGLLELKSTAHKDMKKEMSSYVNEVNQDPTSLNSNADDSGVWFDVIREGQGFKTEYSVKRCQNRVKNGAKVSYEDDQTPLPESVVENYDNLAYDLSAIYQIKTYEELQEILNANMANLIDLCPEADLSDEQFHEALQSELRKPAVEAVSKSTKTITTRFDDADDDAPPVKSKPRATGTATVTDDFMDEADAILNS